MSIKTDAQTIKNETVAGANTAQRVGSNLEDIADDLILKGSQINDLQQNQVTGVEVYSTLADLPSTGSSLTSYKVSNDTTSANNGYYHWNGSSYVKDNGIYENEIYEASDAFYVQDTVTRKRDARDLFPSEYRKRGNKLIYDLDGVTYNEIYTALRESDYADPLNWINKEIELKPIYNLFDLEIIAEDRYLDYNSSNLTYSFLTNFPGYSDSGFIELKPNTYYINNLSTAGNRTILLDSSFQITRILGNADPIIKTESNEVYINFNLTNGQSIASKMNILSQLYLIEPINFNKYFEYDELNTLDTSKLNLEGVLASGGTGQVIQPSKYMRTFLSSLCSNIVSVQKDDSTYSNLIRESYSSDINNKYITASTLVYLPKDDISDIDVHFYSLLSNSVVQFHIEDYVNVQKISDKIYYVSAGGRANASTTDEVRFEFKVKQGSSTGSGATLELAEIGYLRYNISDNNSYISFSFEDSYIKKNIEILKPNFYGKPFSKITLIGTSIEEGGYFDEVAKKYSLVEDVDYLNFGYSGGVCIWDTANLTDAHIKSSWSATLAEKQTEATSRGITLTSKDENVCYDQSTLPNADSDLIIIGTYGINSRSSSYPNRYETSSSYEFDRTSIYGAYNYVLRELFQATPSARVIILGQIDSIGNDLTTVNNIQKLVAERWNVYFSNWVNRLGVNDETISHYMSDGLHPDQSMKDVMAKMLIKDLLLRQ